MADDKVTANQFRGARGAWTGTALLGLAGFPSVVGDTV